MQQLHFFIYLLVNFINCIQKGARTFMDILLIRHGQTSWNIEGRLQGSTDIPLNKEGILQAELCAQFLKTVNLTTLISSPLSRAKQTAEIIAGACHLPIVEMDAFREKSFGDAEGLTPIERQEKYTIRPFPNEELYFYP